MILLFYDTGLSSGALNMAIDEVLLKKKDPVLRFYHWNDKTITLGRYQTCREINITAARKDNIPLIRRETGGKALLHDDELTISLILNKYQAPVPLKRFVRKVGECIVHGLQLLGIDAQQTDQSCRVAASAHCFSVHSPYEVIVAQKKIAGIAGRIYSERVLYQISVPYSINMNDIKKYFYFINEDEIKALKMTGLGELLAVKYNPDSIKKTILSGFKSVLSAVITNAKLTDKELEQAQSISEKKYSLDKWNYAR